MSASEADRRFASGLSAGHHEARTGRSSARHLRTGPSGAGEAAEREVDVAALDGRRRAPGRSTARTARARCRAIRPGSGASRREHPRADALVRRHPQRARLARVQRGHVRARGLEARRDRLRVPQQKLARLGQRDRARTARPVDADARRRCARAWRSAGSLPTACSRAARRRARRCPRWPPPPAPRDDGARRRASCRRRSSGSLLLSVWVIVVMNTSTCPNGTR